MNQHVSMSTVTIKGQVVIPVRLRRKVGLKKGTKVYMEEKNGDIVIHPLTAAWADRGLGMIKDGPSLTKALEASRAEENAREERKLERRRRA